MNTGEQYLDSATNLLLEKDYFFMTSCYKCILIRTFLLIFKLLCFPTDYSKKVESNFFETQAKKKLQH